MTDDRLYENDYLVIRKISEEEYKVRIKCSDEDVSFTLPVSRTITDSQGRLHYTDPLDTLMSGLYRFLDVCHHSGQLEEGDYYNPDM